MAAEGISNLAISRTLKLSRPTVIQWRQRFEVFGKEVLINQNYSKAGRPRQHSENELEQLRIEATKLLKTAGLRKAAAILGVSKSSLQRILSS